VSFVRTNIKLVFADDEFAGLEVVCRRPSIGHLMRIRRLARLEDDEAGLDELFNALAAGIIRWNVADELVDQDTGAVVAQVDVKPDREGLAGRDFGMVMAILNAWMDAVDVAPPLPMTSNSGGPSPAQFDLTAALSESPENSPTPSS
jgi:hypothetical protein